MILQNSERQRKEANRNVLMEKENAPKSPESTSLTSVHLPQGQCIICEAKYFWVIRIVTFVFHQSLSYILLFGLMFFLLLVMVFLMFYMLLF